MAVLTYRLVKGSRLSHAELDANFHNLDDRLVEVEDVVEVVAQIDDIVQNEDGSLTIIMDDYTEFGPFALPVAAYRPRGEWLPETNYSPLDLFYYEGSVYAVNLQHTSALTFDPGAQQGAEDIYSLLIPAQLYVSVPVPQEISSSEVTMGLSMANKWNYLTSPTGTNLIIPKDATVAHPVGTEIHVFSTVLAVDVTFEPEDGTVTVLWDEECIAQLSGRYVAVTFKKITTDLWHVVGSLALDPSP